MSRANKKYSMKRFKDAVIRNDFRKMERIFRAQVNCPDPEWLNGYIPLRLACQYGRFHVAPQFLNYDSVRVNNVVQRTEDTALHWAVFHTRDYSWYLETIEKLVKKGADMNIENLQRQNAFDIALQLKKFCILKALINHTTDDNVEERTYLKLLSDLMFGDHVELVELLLTKCPSININRTPLGINYLAFAVKKKQHGIIRSFVKRGVDLDYYNEFSEPNSTALITACRIGDLESVKILLDGGASMDVPEKTSYSLSFPIHVAAYKNHIDIVGELLDRGEDIHKTDEDSSVGSETILQIASGCRYLEMVKFLLERGADINFDTGANRNSTAIQSAAVRENENRPDVFEYILKLDDFKLSIKDVKYIVFESIDILSISRLYTLLEYMENLHPQDQLRYDSDVLVFNNANFRRPLIHYAARIRGNVDRAVLNGSDVNLKDPKGRTALHVACRHRLLYSLTNLIQYGADINIKCDAGRLPIYYALDETIQESDTDTEEENRRPEMPEEHKEEEIVDYYCRHVKKLQFLGHFISKENDNFASENLDDPSEYKKKCKEEEEIMKKEVITNEIPYITYYDFVTVNLRKRIRFMNNPEISKVLEEYSNYWKKFPKFSDVIRNLYYQAYPRKKLLEKFEECEILQFLYQNLPFIWVEEVATFFSNKELKDVVNMFTFFDK